MKPCLRRLAIASGLALGAVPIAAPRADAASAAAAPLRVCADPA